MTHLPPAADGLRAELDDAIETAREALAVAAPAPDVAAALGRALADRYGLDGGEADRDEAITWLRRACDMAPAAEKDPDDHLLLAMMMIDRCEDQRDCAEIAAGIGYADRALAGLDGEPSAFARYVLGIGHLVWADIGSARAEFPVAVAHLREALAMLPDGHPGRADMGARLGVALAVWALADPAEAPDETGGRAGEAIGFLAEAARQLAPDDAYLVRVRYWLATASATRFMWHAGSEADRQFALSEFGGILEDYAPDAALADLCHIFMAFLQLLHTAPEALRRRSAQNDHKVLVQLLVAPPERPAPAAAKAALDHLDRISGPGTTDAPYAAFGVLLRGMASAALSTGDLPGDGAGPTIAAFEEALRRMPADHPDAGELRGMINLLHGWRAAQAEGASPSVRSMESLAAAAWELGNSGPVGPVLRGLLGAAPGRPDSGQPAPAEEGAAAIDLLEVIIEEMPEDHPARAGALIRLSGLLISQAFQLDQSVPRLKKLRHKLNKAVATNAGENQAGQAINLLMLGMAEGIEGLLESNAELTANAVHRLQEAANIAPAEGHIRAYVHVGLICLLCHRYSVEGGLQYLDAAIYYARLIARSTAGKEARDPLLLTAHYLLLVSPAVRNPDEVTPAMLTEMRAQAEALQARFPEGHAMQTALAADLNAFQILKAGLGGLAAPVRRDTQLQEAADAAVAIARGTPTDDPFYALHLGTAGNVRAMQGTLARDRRALSEGIAMLAEACAAAGNVPDHRRGLLTMLACALRMRYDMTHDHDDLNNLISRLEEARRLTDEEDGGAAIAVILYLSGLSYHERNDQNLQDRRRAVEYGLRALRERSITVMLQSTAERAFDATLAAAGEAADVARWCLAGRDHAAAVEALERGRGMVLHAATADADVPVMLRETGYDTLASEWEETMAAASGADPDPWDQFPSALTSPLLMSGPADEVLAFPEVRLPSDLRARIVKALTGTDLERLLAPPPVAEISQALRSAGAQALVYLLPRAEGAAGGALVIDASGQIREIRLPQLAAGPRGPVAEFAVAQRELYGSETPSDAARSRWRQALGALCDWAWTAGMDRIIESISDSPWQRARLVLVPVGDLGVVPWHAARRSVGDGRHRYACQDAVISYAASARQFTTAVMSGRRDWRSAVALVRVADSGLYFASREIREIHRLYYPEGVQLGDREHRWPPATPGNVLGLLPRSGADGVSLLHLGCHAQPAARPVEGRLLLCGGEALSMRDILQQARARGRDTPGYLVALAACGSDLADGHHDEALTLATSFLAAGAAGVIGTRWPVEDMPTMAFMIMFHHYLNSGYDEPSTALRAAQAWMLNPDRAFPEGFPGIARVIRGSDFSDPGSWAAFSYQGR